MLFLCVFPLKAVTDDVNNPAQNTTVIYPGYTMCQRERQPFPWHRRRVDLRGQPVTRPSDSLGRAPFYRRPRCARQIASGNASAITIQDRFHKQTIIRNSPADTWPSRAGRKSFIRSLGLSLRPCRRIHLPENREKTSQIRQKNKPHHAVMRRPRQVRSYCPAD